MPADGWMAYSRRSGGGSSEDQEKWLKERFFQHGGNAEAVRQDLLREQGVDVSPSAQFSGRSRRSGRC